MLFHAMRKNTLAKFLQPFSDPFIAEFCGIKDYRTVARWRRGEHFPKPRNWMRLAELCRVSPAALQRAYEEWRAERRRKAWREEEAR